MSLRVAFISQPWSHVVPPIRQADSIAIWTYEVAKRLANDAKISIYCKTVADRPARETIEGVEYLRVPVLQRQRWRRVLRTRLLDRIRLKSPEFSSALYHIAYISMIAADCRRRRYDVVHVHQFSQFAVILKRIAPQTKVILHMQAEWLTQLDRSTISKRLKSVDAIVCCSAYLADKVRARFPEAAERCFVLTNGVDMEALAATEPVPQRERIGERKVMFVGRVSPEKAVHVIVEAWSRVVGEVRDAVLEILGPDASVPKDFIVGLSDDPLVQGLAPWCGEGYYERLKALVPDALRESVRFRGEVDRTQLRSHYADAHVLVNPSISETFGMTLIEALVSGVPVVATDRGGMPELIVDGKTGLMAKAGDSESLATAIVRLLQDANLRQSIADAGREMVSERFTWEVAAQQTLECYRHVLRSVGGKTG